MLKKLIPIIPIALSIFVVILVLSCAVFVKPKSVVPIQPVVSTTMTTNTTTTITPTTTTTIEESDITKDWQVYRNEKYNYEVKFPEDWRIATEYMKTIAELTKDPKHTPTENDFVVITKLSLTKEKEFIKSAKREHGIALSPYFDFGLGKTITILPVYGNKEDLYKEVKDSIIIKSSNIRDEVLSGMTVIRFRRYEFTDNGEFDYEVALFPFKNVKNLAVPYDNSKKYNYIEIKIERNKGDFEEDIFNKILFTFKFIG